MCPQASITKGGYLSMIGALRGLAALGVAIFHIVNSPAGFESNQAVRSFILNGAHGVQVFFVISGIVIPLSLLRKKYSIGSFGLFFLKRALRIEPTYVVFIAISLLWMVLRELLIQDGGVPFPTVRAILHNVFYIVPFTEENWINPVFWTLGIELQFYLLCAIFMGRVGLFDSYAKLLLLPVLTTLSTSLIPDGFVFDWIGFFALGFYVALWIEGRLTLQKLGYLIAFQSICICWSHGVYFAFIGVVTTMLIVTNPNGGNWKPLQYLGNQSYSLYLVHSLVGTAFVNISMRFLPYTHPVIHWVLVVTALGLSIGFAQVLYKWIESPTLIRSKRIKL